MNFREAAISDITRMHTLRMSVTENRLSNPDAISYNHYEDYIVNRGKGWVCESGGDIVGFAVVDITAHNIWALFVMPGYEGRGIGRKLQELMLDWHFSISKHTLWLGTSPETRAAVFYRKAGWIEAGNHVDGEVRLEMTWQEWKKQRDR